MIGAQAMPKLLARIDLHFVVATPQMRSHSMYGNILLISNFLRGKAIIQRNRDVSLTGGEPKCLVQIRQCGSMLAGGMLKGNKHSTIFRRRCSHDPMPPGLETRV